MFSIGEYCRGGSPFAYIMSPGMVLGHQEYGSYLMIITLGMGLAAHFNIEKIPSVSEYYFMVCVIRVRGFGFQELHLCFTTVQGVPLVIYQINH